MPRVDDSPVDLSEGAACFGGVQLEAQFKLGSPGDPPHRPPCPDMGVGAGLICQPGPFLFQVICA